MILTGNDLDTKWADMFLHCKDVEAAKAKGLRKSYIDRLTDGQIGNGLSLFVLAFGLICILAYIKHLDLNNTFPKFRTIEDFSLVFREDA